MQNFITQLDTLDDISRDEGNGALRYSDRSALHDYLADCSLEPFSQTVFGIVDEFFDYHTDEFMGSAQGPSLVDTVTDLVLQLAIARSEVRMSTYFDESESSAPPS